LLKTRFFGRPVKKTYLTLIGLTVVFGCKIKGFVHEKNRFREAVKIMAFMPNSANECALCRQMRAVDGMSVGSAI
jgi:hypothetical protein